MSQLFGNEPEEARPPRLRLFGDEPDEVPKKMARTVIKRENHHQKQMGLFGDEPEEKRPMGKKPNQSSSSSRVVAKPMVLFGDEGEERQPGKSFVAPNNDEDASSDDEGKMPATRTLNLNWSGLKLFQNATFVKQAVESSKPVPKKRTYDNSKRAENAAPKHVNSNKTHAVDPARLAALEKKQHCKCSLALKEFVLISYCVI